jgi:hypothetical protein
MLKKVLYENKHLQIFIDESVPYMAHVWNGFVPSVELRNGILKLTELFKEYAPKYPRLHLLGDTRTLGVISREDMKWLVEDMTPFYVEAGAKYEAFIVSKDAFGQLAVNRYTSQTTEKEYLVAKIFDNTEEALDWLKSV